MWPGQRGLHRGRYPRIAHTQSRRESKGHYHPPTESSPSLASAGAEQGAA